MRLAAASFALAASAALPAFAAEPTGSVALGPLNFRAGPGLDARVLRLLDEKSDMLNQTAGALKVSNIHDLPARAAALTRLWAYTWRESLELLRDPIRLFFALAGPIILMITVGYGISFDVDELSFAVFDQDQTPESRRRRFWIIFRRILLLL